MDGYEHGGSHEENRGAEEDGGETHNFSMARFARQSYSSLRIWW